MINQYKGMKAEKIVSNIPLPAGGYIAEIINAKIQEYDWGSVVVVAFDISEGDYKNHFQKQFDNNTNEDKKWKGTYRLTVPDEKNKYFESQQKIFNNFIFALEDSNSGYHFDWDESKFKGKKVGVIYRNKEWEMNGNSGWTTECGAVTDIAAIRENTFKPLKDKPLRAHTQTTPIGNIDVIDDDVDDLPF